ncbi:MAG: PEP-CTERM sorting domain-containing protein [Pseudomonadota bacterium]
MWLGLLATILTARTAQASVIVEFDLTNLNIEDFTGSPEFTVSAGTLDLTISARAERENRTPSPASVFYHDGLGMGVLGFGGALGDVQTVRGDQFAALDGNRGNEELNLSFNNSVSLFSLSFFDLPESNGDPAALLAFENGGWTVNEGNGPLGNRDLQNRFAFYDANAAGGNGNGAINELRQTGTDQFGGTFQNRIPLDDYLRIYVGGNQVALFLSGVAVELTEEQAIEFGIISVPEPSSFALFALGGLSLLRRCRNSSAATRRAWDNQSENVTTFAHRSMAGRFHRVCARCFPS